MFCIWRLPENVDLTSASDASKSRREWSVQLDGQGDDHGSEKINTLRNTVITGGPVLLKQEEGRYSGGCVLRHFEIDIMNVQGN